MRWRDDKAFELLDRPHIFFCEVERSSPFFLREVINLAASIVGEVGPLVCGPRAAYQHRRFRNGRDLEYRSCGISFLIILAGHAVRLIYLFLTYGAALSRRSGPRTACRANVQSRLIHSKLGTGTSNDAPIHLSLPARCASLCGQHLKHEIPKVWDDASDPLHRPTAQSLRRPSPLDGA